VPSAPRSFLRRHAVKLVASALITAGVIFTVTAGGLKLVPDSGDFSTVKWWGIALYVPTLVGTWWFRSVRWRFLLRSVIEVPKIRIFAVSSAGFAAILLLPFRLGELARPYMLRTRPEDIVPGKPVLTMTTATTSIVAERVIDGLTLSLILAIVLVVVPTVHPLPDQVVGLPISVASVRASAFVLLGAFAAAFAVLAVFYFARSFAHRVTTAIVGRISPALAAKLTGLFEKLADGLHVLRSGRDVAGFLVETMLYWFFNALGMWLLAIGCGIVHGDGSSITFLESVGLMGMLGCAILIPGPPGLLGVFQAGIYAGMTMYFPTAIVTGPGAAYVFLVYGVQVVFTLALGAWGLWHEGGTRRLRGALDTAPPAGAPDAVAS
jgi:glycosyltransferase 2 family protein